MIKWLGRKKISEKYLEPGDVIRLIWDGKTVLSKEVIKSMVINEAGVFEFDNEFEMKQGIGGVFGKRTEDSE
ncbi:MAG TPA: hypothetical protein ENI07_13185 [Desulfobacterales bacterium]|nr:hypothetical protein [Desulfobacterales bacterium]